MNKKVFIAIFFAFTLMFAARVNAQTVTGSIGNGTIKRGSTAQGSIVLSIPGGLHVNSSRPNNQYAIPTRVSLIGSGLKLKSINYPRGINRKFEFSDAPINVYEGRAVFNFKIAVPANFKGKTVRIRAIVNYQACTEEICFQPKQKQITLTATVS